MNIQGSWTNLLLWTHWIYSYIENNYSERNPKSSSVTLLHWVNEKKIHIKMGRRGWRHNLAVNPHLMWQRTMEVKPQPKLLPEEWKTWTPHWHPSFWDLHWREELPKHLALKANGACIHKTHKAIANCEVVLRGLIWTHLAILQGPVQKHLTETHQVFLGKRPICLSESFGMRGRHLN